MIAIPDVRQREDYDCGSACLDAILQHFGVRTAAALAVPYVANPVQGTDPTAAEAVLRATGLPVVSGTMVTGDLRHFVRSARPVMCPVSIYGGHWVIAVGFGPRGVTFHDPLAGRRTVTVEAWNAAWKDVNRYGHVFDHWGIAAG